MSGLPSPVAAIADLTLLGPELVLRVREAFGGGLAWVVLRAKEACSGERLALARELLRLCPGLFLSVHGDADVCREVRAQGVHLPSRGPGPERVRAELPAVLLGMSCHGAGEVEAAERAGANYAFLSPFFAPTSKPLRGGALGREGFRAIASGAKIPLIALGGITPDRVPLAAEAGAAGIAVLGDLFLAPDVARRARQLREAGERAFGR